MKNKKTLSIIIRSSLLWITVGTIAIPYNLLALTLYILPVRARHKAITSWGWIFTALSKWLCGADYKIIGQENMIKGPAIIASNHQSAWETMSFATLFPQHVWILKRELLKFPIFGWTVATLSPIAIDRSKGSEAIQQILSQGIERIKNGFWILAFPEGTRVVPGVIKPFKTGVAKLAQALNLPIIPVSHNAGYVMPRKSFLLYPGTITIVIDKPMYPNNNEAPEEFTDRIEKVIRGNLNPLLHTNSSIEEGNA